MTASPPTASEKTAPPRVSRRMAAGPTGLAWLNCPSPTLSWKPVRVAVWIAVKMARSIFSSLPDDHRSLEANKGGEPGRDQDEVTEKRHPQAVSRPDRRSGNMGSTLTGSRFGRGAGRIVSLFLLMKLFRVHFLGVKNKMAHDLPVGRQPRARLPRAGTSGGQRVQLAEDAAFVALVAGRLRPARP